MTNKTIIYIWFINFDSAHSAIIKGLAFHFSISLESHSCCQYRRIKSFLGLIHRLLVHDEFDANISERQEQDYTELSFLFDSG